VIVDVYPATINYANKLPRIVFIRDYVSRKYLKTTAVTETYDYCHYSGTTYTIVVRDARENSRLYYVPPQRRRSTVHLVNLADIVLRETKYTSYSTKMWK